MFVIGIGIVMLVVIGAVVVFMLLREDEKHTQDVLTTARMQPLSVDMLDAGRVSTALVRHGLASLEFVHEDLALVKRELHKKIVGMDGFINAIIVNLLCGGHLLVEWVPGLAKTKTIHTFADVMGMSFSRIQFTPDMLPSDIVGVEMYNSQTKSFEVSVWPVMANIVLADEINRTTPKVQAALLESMQEKQVTIWGKTLSLPKPFMVLATQNPLEQEGTYPLPEAQIDRFLFKVLVDYPTQAEEKKILALVGMDEKMSLDKVMSIRTFEKLQKQVHDVVVSDVMVDYITRLVEKTRQPHRHVLYGASPRWSIGLMQAAKAVAFVEGREYVTHEDVQKVVLPVLRHRIVLHYDAKIDKVHEDQVLCDMVADVMLV